MKFKTMIAIGVGTLALGATSLAVVANVGGNSNINAAAGDYQSGFQLVGAALGVGWTNTANTAYQLVEQSDGTFAWTGAFTVERFRLIVAGSWTTSANWDKVLSTSEK